MGSYVGIAKAVICLFSAAANPALPVKDQFLWVYLLIWSSNVVCILGWFMEARRKLGGGVSLGAAQARGEADNRHRGYEVLTLQCLVVFGPL